MAAGVVISLPLPWGSPEPVALSVGRRGRVAACGASRLLGLGLGTAIGARRGPPAWGIGGGNPQVIAWWTVNAGSIHG